MTKCRTSPVMKGHVSWIIKHAPHNYTPTNKRNPRTSLFSRGEVQGNPVRGVRKQQIVPGRRFRQSRLLVKQDESTGVTG